MLCELGGRGFDSCCGSAHSVQIGLLRLNCWCRWKEAVGEADGVENLGGQFLLYVCTKKAIERIPIFQFSPPRKVLLSAVTMRHRKAEKLAPVTDIRLAHP